ncbi:MAG: FAD-binding oxidoreductase, partial [Alphaproteobacteria bacterium]
MAQADILIIGAGIAGVSAGFGLAGQGHVTIVEQEPVPAYHTTGRSAAFYAETYGNEAVRRLTTASKGFFLSPPPGFADLPLVRDRGALFIAREDQDAALSALFEAKSAVLPSVARVDRTFIEEKVPAIRPGYAVAGVWDPECRDIDVHALHQSFLKGFKAQGGRLVTDAPVVALERRAGRWIATTRNGATFTADLVVNAAGAWADQVAEMAGAAPVGLSPKRRTVILFPA